MAGPSTDPLGQVERAQIVIEKGPLSAVAAFGILAAIVSIWLLLRANDRHRKELIRIYEAERGRAVELQVVLHRFLDYVDEVMRKRPRHDQKKADG